MFRLRLGANRKANKVLFTKVKALDRK